MPLYVGRVVVVLRGRGVTGDGSSTTGIVTPPGPTTVPFTNCRALSVEHAVARKCRIDMPVSADKRAFDIVDVAALVVVVQRCANRELVPSMIGMLIIASSELLSSPPFGRGPAARRAGLEFVESPACW